MLAHARTQDLTDTKGNKVLFIDEIQSDLHQQGKKEGYETKEETLKRKENREKISKLIKEYADLDQKYADNRDAYVHDTKEYKEYQDAEKKYWSLRSDLAGKIHEKNGNSLGSAKAFLGEIEECFKEHDTAEDFIKHLGDYFLWSRDEITALTDEDIKSLFELRRKYDQNWSVFSNKLSLLRMYYDNSPEGKKLIDRMEEIKKERYNIEADSKLRISEMFPFKKNWHEFVLRRLINDAVTKGYDKVAWTTGRQQRERYNLAKHIDMIMYHKYYNHPNDVDKGKIGSVEIHAYKDGNLVFDKYVNPEELANYVGKDLSLRILNSQEGKGIINDLDSSVNLDSNNGMYVFYDQEIPNYLNKYLKKWNSKVEDVTIKYNQPAIDSNGVEYTNPKESVQQGFTITKEMRDSIKQNGQPLFSDRKDLDATTPSRKLTPEEQEAQRRRRELAQAIKQRRFFENVYNTPDTPKEMRKEMRKNEKMYEYTPISNQETLDKAIERVNNIKNIRDVFLANDLKTAEDTAVGEVLIKQAMERGDYEDANSLAAALASKLTNSGQIIQAAAMFRRMTPSGMLLFAEQQINKINKELSEKYKLDKWLKKKDAPQIEMTEEKTQFINDQMEQMQKLEDLKQNAKTGFENDVIDREQDIIVAKIMAKLGEDIPVSKLDKLASWRNISLLLNSKTIMRNLISNGMFSAIEDVVDTLGVPLDKAVSLVTGQRSLLAPNLKTQAKGFKKGLDYAIYDTKAGISTSLGGNKYEINQNHAFKNKLLQKLETASYFGVEGLDRPFMQAKYESALEMLMKLDNKVYGKDIATEEQKAEALEIAKYTTFKEKNVVSDTLSKLKRNLNLGKPIGAADMLGLTYTNVPGNLTKKAFDYSPTGLYNVIKKYAEMRGKQSKGEDSRQSQREFVQATTRVLIGTGIMALSAKALLDGILTASGENENDKVKALTNEENYAINVSAFLRWLTGKDTTKQNGDLYVTYSNYEPLSSIISAAAEMASAGKKGDNAGTIAYKGLVAWINTIAELSTLDNFSSLFEYGDLGGAIARSLAQYPSSFIPTAAKQIAQLFEGSSKANYSDNFMERYLINPIKQRIPGAISSIESSYDTMGNEKQSFDGSTGLARAFNVFLNTSFVSTTNMDNTKQELYDLYLSTGSTDHLPKVISNSFTYQGEKITLTAKEKAELQKQVGLETAAAFKVEMATSEYQNMSDTEKVSTLKKIIDDVYTEAKSDVVLEPRGLTNDARFTPDSTLKDNGKRLDLTDDMKREYEQIASDYYTDYEKQGIYSEDKLREVKSKAKEYAKKQMMEKYSDQVYKK